MSRWFRHYVGMMRDPKLVRASVQSRQPVERVLWVWGAILESAAEINDNGRFDFDAGEAAYFLRVDESDVLDIISALVSLGRLLNGVVVRWGDRQFDSDKSKDRQKRYRERLKTSRDGGVTSRDSAVTAQETDTYKAAGTDARELRSALVGSMGPLAWCAERHSKFHVLSEPANWITSGCDLEADILPAIKAKCLSMQQRGDEPRGWKIFEQAVFEARDRRLAPAPPVQQRAASPPIRRSGRESPLDVANRIILDERAKAEIPGRIAERISADGG